MRVVGVSDKYDGTPPRGLTVEVLEIENTAFEVAIPGTRLSRGSRAAKRGVSPSQKRVVHPPYQAHVGEAVY